MTPTRQTRLAIIGCGTVAQAHLLPALHRIGWRPDVLSDPSSPNLDAAKQIAGRSKSLVSVSDWTTVADKFDAAIVAVPHSLHGPIGLALLRAGKHVFMQSPLAIHTSECEAMLAAAEQTGVIFSVSLPRRYLHVGRWTVALLRSGVLGQIKRFDIREGFVVDRTASTDGVLRPAVSGGGVLMHTGAQTIDQLTWWLGDIAKIDYRDDSGTGVEADCVIDCEMTSEAIGRIELSRCRDLPDSCRIEGTDGFVEVHLSRNEVLDCSPNARAFTHDGMSPGTFPAQGFPELLSGELKDLYDEVKDGVQRGVSAREGLRPVDIIELCYATRGVLSMPWALAVPASESAPVLPAGSRVVITGATGFIGGRLAERLLEQGTHVRCLVRNFGAAVRLARLPVDIRRVDLSDPTAVTAAVEDCDYIFHCAYDPRLHQENLAAGRNLIAASLALGVKRLVHTSTFSVYEPFPDGPLTEETPDGDRKWVYTRTKLELEQAVLEATRTQGLRGTIVQPTIVYGPFSKPWTIAPAENLLYGTVILPEHGEGLCNALYVDDLVDAMILAAIKPEAIGERFVISGPETTTWGNFFESFAKALGIAGPRYRPAEQIAKENSGLAHDLKMVISNPRKIIQVAMRSPTIRDLLRNGLTLLPKPLHELANRICFGTGERRIGVIHLPGPQLLRLYNAKASVGSEKARRLLGYAPRFDFKTGMAMTAKYLTWAYGHSARPAPSRPDQSAATRSPPRRFADAD